MTRLARGCAVLAMVLGPAVPALAQTQPLPLPALIAELMPEVVNISFVRHNVPAANMASMQSEAAALVPTGHGVGTGFVVDPNGIICTNRHVTDGGDALYVQLSDGTHLRGELIYRSPDIDMALIRVQPSHPLKAVTFGDSDLMVQGTPVVAIGNPLGLGGTVTTGIISARDRTIHETPYDSFLQIDAAINPGNSGGPLFNRQGEAIGMNTAYNTLPGSVGSGSIGLNFSIPGNDVKLVLDLLRKYGHIRHGEIGLASQDVTPELAEAVGLKRVTGAIVSAITAKGPADLAGMRVGDVILSMAGETIANARAVARYVVSHPEHPGVPVRILRDGVELMVSVTLGEEPPETETVNMAMAPIPRMRITPEELGVEISPLTDALRAQYKFGADARGMVLTKVAAHGLAAYLGMSEGALLEQIQGTPINTQADIKAAVDKAWDQKRTQVAVLLSDADGARWIAAPLTTN